MLPQYFDFDKGWFFKYKEFYAQNICLTGPMALFLLFPSSEGVEKQNLFFSKFDYAMELATCILLNILEAHPGVWEWRNKVNFMFGVQEWG